MRNESQQIQDAGVHFVHPNPPKTIILKPIYRMNPSPLQWIFCTEIRKKENKGTGENENLKAEPSDPATVPKYLFFYKIQNIKSKKQKKIPGFWNKCIDFCCKIGMNNMIFFQIMFPVCPDSAIMIL
ncbi:MAG: hypothetical protein R2941_00555 [Desulfobacterales bacterium]